jgi:hypothetical protein
MARRIYTDTRHVSSLADVFNNADKTGFVENASSSTDRMAMAYALAWLENVRQDIPTQCSKKTRIEIEKLLAKAKHLIRRIQAEALISIMRKADEKREYEEDCGTKALWYIYQAFCNKVGGQDVEFLPYVEAAAQASLKSVWNDNMQITIACLSGSKLQRLGQLFDYALHLGFHAEGANDEDGNTVIVLHDEKHLAAHRKKVKLKPKSYTNSTAARSIDGLTSM